MAFPKWLTSAGDLGIVPELEYYQLSFDAYDENLFAFNGNVTASSITIDGVSNLDFLIQGQGITGTGIPNGTVISSFDITSNTITLSANATISSTGVQLKAVPIQYSRVSGVLPEGIQIVPYGRLVGIPISTPTVGADLNQKYTFSIRATNIYTGNVSDRTFNLTITNVAPPIITPKTIINNVKLDVVGNISANVGDYLTQSISNGNALIVTKVINSPTITVEYTSTSPAFILGHGNLRVVSANVSLYPSKNVNAYPITSTVVSSISQRDLGIYIDGTVVNMQLQAVEFANSATLTWSVKSGDASLPEGLTLSSDGLLSGYIKPIIAIGPSSDPDWDKTPWDELAWDFTIGTTSKSFAFTVEVTDGVNYDLCTYTILVYPRHFFTADSGIITVDATVANTLKLSVDTGSRHYPIILSTQSDISTEREGGAFSFHVEAIDLDGDVLQYSVPALSSGAFDEQSLVPSASISYITSTLVGGNLFTGVFPKTSIVNVSVLELIAGYSITANIGDNISQSSSGANATVTANVVNSGNVPVTITSTSFFTTGTGNLSLNGNTLIKSSFISGNWSNVNIVPAAVLSTPTIVSDNTAPELFTGAQIQFLQTDPITSAAIWYNGTVTNATTIRVSGNTLIRANVGDYISQTISGANATVTNTSPTTGTLNLGGNSLVGTLTIFGTVISPKVGDFITQPSTGANATVTSNVSYAVAIPVVYTAGVFNIGSGNILLNGATVNAYPINLTSAAMPLSVTANVGDIITQQTTGANATVLQTQPGGISLSVQFNSNVFALGSGNIAVNGSNVLLYPTSAVTQADIGATYNSLSPFIFNTQSSTSYVYVAGNNSWATPTRVISVGVSTGLPSTQGIIGYDEGKFDQGTLSLPQGLVIDQYSGWMTGTLPTQTINEITYDFSVIVNKRDYPGYTVDHQYSLTVLGDLNNTINWLTPSDLGTIENGAISDLFVKAISSKGKTLRYTLTNGAYLRLPQGLELITNGTISGRVSFEVFSLDQGTTTIDGGTSTFDNTYRFSITASDFDQTISSSREFTVRVLQRNIVPYENLYLKALLSRSQRTDFIALTEDRTVFPLDLIYRNEDPYYGIAKDIKTLFLAGLNPSLISEYAVAVSTNHYTKHITFGDIKTAVAVDSSYNVVEIATGINVGTFQDTIGFIPTSFDIGYPVSPSLPAGTKLDTEHTKYEVVYLEIIDDNTNSLGYGPADTINLAGQIATPYYDANDNSFTIAYPNSFENMGNVVVNNVGYVNKGALPDWMTSKQPDGRVLGFTRAVVLAYTVAGASNTIAYRFKQAGYNLNEFDFTVDRYQLDNNYSANYDITTNRFIHSKETTFDRYPSLNSVFNTAGTVDYAVNLSFEDINEHSVTYINSLGGLDNIYDFVDGETLVFFEQEFQTASGVGDLYNEGWSTILAPWDFESIEPWDIKAWDASGYVPGYTEHLLSPSIANQRIGVWQIHIDSFGLVTLTFIETINFYNTLYIRNGFTHGGTHIYYDPVVKANHTVPNYSSIPQQINTNSTRFDGGGTKFLSYRDSYSVPEQGDKYIKFVKNGVFT